MKLKNKKTGEIVDIELLYVDEYIKLPFKTDNGEEVTLELLNEWYKDYKEPLIKDEKIRKAVRAWAEANKAIEISLRYDDKRISFWSAKADSVIEFADDVDIDCKAGGFYTITELCGEEE